MTRDGYAEEIEEFLTGARHAPPSDRILTTVMFTDIVGSTERAAALGDARWRELDGPPRRARCAPSSSATGAAR